MAFWLSDWKWVSTAGMGLLHLFVLDYGLMNVY